MAPTPRRGTLYIAVLTTAMLVTIIGLGGLLAARSQFNTAGGDNEGMAARWCAQSAVELGLFKIRNDANWRTTLGAGNWITNLAVGNGTCSLTVTRVTDADADLYNDDWVLLGVGVVGGATRKVQLTLTDGVTPAEWRQVVN
ncbi:MAG: hypothetical protein U1D55_17450 [Phycisphaerae bacterium]